MKLKYLAVFDNLVTDDIIVHTCMAESEEKAWEKFYEMSKQTGLSEGNFEMFLSLDYLEAMQTYQD